MKRVRKYTQEQRLTALNEIGNGKRIGIVARKHRIPLSTLHSWAASKRLSKQVDLTKTPKGAPPLADNTVQKYDELADVKSINTRLKNELDKAQGREVALKGIVAAQMQAIVDIACELANKGV